jgi:hypothetical protein
MIALERHTNVPSAWLGVIMNEWKILGSYQVKSEDKPFNWNKMDQT